MTNFAAFFESLWQKEAFPWQTILAARGVSGGWPEAINLPTASGKTASLDAAIFALAATAHAPVEERMPRRIWFVVDRRIVVDEAYERAKKVARKLADASEGPVREVADRLRDLSGTGRALAVARLRGGAWRDDGWARLPSQPAVICSTVDQVGSALLFRAYGHSDRTASIYAGLAAHDSLILLDEAHCAVPFLQTLRAVARFRGDVWATQPLKTPFRFSIMSATPPADIPEDATFPMAAERTAALDHPTLRERFIARKVAALVRPVKDDKFVGEAASCARRFADADAEDVGKLVQGFEAATWTARLAERQGKPRVAVMVNRVAAAEQIAERLREELRDNAHIVLLTGRMRPLDRDDLVKQWEPKLRAGATGTLPKPVIVVTTQCLEVGADFSFDALVTECASLDALRQRFGRLDRLGALSQSPAAILTRERDTKEPEDDDVDPIYGRAIYETWKWLNEPEQCKADGAVDFGIEAMNTLVDAFRERCEEQFQEHFKALLAPTPDAPVLLPAHLDLLCQTSPRPTPEPDVALFLHGKDRGAPEARVVFRADLAGGLDMKETQTEWLDILSVVPPTSPETLTVPLYRLRRWLADTQADDMGGDVEGAREASDEQRESLKQSSRAPFFIWRGRDRSRLSRDPSDIRPDDLVVLRLEKSGLGGLAQTVEEPDGLGENRLDLAERALRMARGRVVLRLHRDVLAPWSAHRLISGLLDLATTAETEHGEVKTALAEIKAALDAATAGAIDEAPLALPGWLGETIGMLVNDDFWMEDHPGDGLILTGKKERRSPDHEVEDDPLADEEDLTSKTREAVTLRDHTADVHAVVSDFAPRCLPPGLAEVFANAAQGHDLGKLDPRFQIMLRDGAEDAVDAEPLAKSEWLPERQRRRLEIREDARLPTGFRHEFLSLQVAERFGLTPVDDGARDLTLHLIASHHGYARPFAPVIPDPLLEDGGQPEVSIPGLGLDLTLTAGERQALPPAYRLDSGVPDRFWRLTRRYGWWGLAYLEAVFRLADWQASRKPGTAVQQPAPVSPSPSPSIPSSATTIALDALDGANPLGFLAALGTLRLLTRLFPAKDVRLSWGLRLGAWRPLLSMRSELDRKEIAAALTENGVDLAAMFSPELLAASEQAGPIKKSGEEGWKDKLRFPPPAYRHHCEGAVSASSIADHRLTDFAAAWAGETATDLVGKVEVARRTRFDFTAGNQALIDMFRAVRQAVSAEVIARSLFDRWIYLQGVSLRWDPQDEKRQWALQAIDPKNNSQNPPLADAGANFLAIEALPLFPLVPDRWASQPGFDRHSGGRHWRWPIWTRSLSLDTIRSLLTLPLADSEEWSVRALGVSTVFQSAIVQPSGRYRCFTPARSL
jgi:CRISPR-associated endonuclease/helicase Cas3